MKSRISKGRYLLLYFLPSLITLGWTTAAIKGVPPVVAVVGLIFVVAAWYGYLTIPFEFEVTTENSIKFYAILRKVTVQANDVREIDARLWNRGMVTIRLSQGAIQLFRTMPKLNELIEKVKEENPCVRVRGRV